MPKLYNEIAPWWPLISPPEEYEEEAGIYRAGSMDGLLSPESLRTSPLALSYAIALAAMAPSMATWIFLSPLLLMAFAVVMPSIDCLRRRRKEMSEAAGHRSTGVAGEPFSSDAEA